MILNSPISGEVSVFTDENGNKGVRIVSDDEWIYAPGDAVVTSISDDLNSVELLTDDGLNVRIRIGSADIPKEKIIGYVSADDKVKSGDLLLEFDKYGIQRLDLDSTITLTVLNSADFFDVLVLKKETDSKEALVSVI